jgi:hypothetical protein
MSTRTADRWDDDCYFDYVVVVVVVVVVPVFSVFLVVLTGSGSGSVEFPDRLF